MVAEYNNALSTLKYMESKWWSKFSFVLYLSISFFFSRSSLFHSQLSYTKYHTSISPLISLERSLSRASFNFSFCLLKARILLKNGSTKLLNFLRISFSGFSNSIFSNFVLSKITDGQFDIKNHDTNILVIPKKDFHLNAEAPAQMIIDNLEIRSLIEKLDKKTENNAKNIEIVFKYEHLDIFRQKTLYTDFISRKKD